MLHVLYLLILVFCISYLMRTILLKRLWLVRFLKKSLLSYQGCIYLIKNTVKLWNISTISNNCFLCEHMLKCNLFLWCKAEFSASLLQFSVSHDPSEIILICWFAAQETFLIIINFENSCAATYFLWKLWHFIFQDSSMNRNFKTSAFIWNRNLL